MTRLERVACPVCGGARSRCYVRKFGLDLVKCRDCGLVYANPRLREAELLERYESPLFFDEYLRNFRAAPEGYDPAFVRGHYRIFLDIAGRYFAPGKKLLDVGCGAGFFVKAAEEAGWKAEGIEISRLASRYAREVVQANVRTARLEAADLAPDSFDLITMLDLVEHLPDPVETMTLAYRVLKPGGVLIVATPDLRSLSRMFLGRCWAALSPAEHLANYDARTLRAALEGSGFRIVAMKNLLILNPEYTHSPETRAARTFKAVHSRFEKTRFAGHLHGFEGLDLVHAGDPGRPHLADLSLAKRFARRAYLRMKGMLRGDILVAIGQKKRFDAISDLKLHETGVRILL